MENEKKNNSGILVGILIGIIIMLLVVIDTRILYICVSIIFNTVLIVIEKNIQIIIANTNAAQLSDRVYKICDFFCCLHVLTSFKIVT